jgi:acyl-CoA synthetase (AMP-forming)/AMP-acid ligase II
MAGGPGPGRPPALVGSGATPGSPGGAWPDSARVPPRAQRLCTLLAGTAHAHPHRVAFVDPPHKPLWSGRPAITWTYAAAAEIVARLANGLRSWRLAPGSRIGLALPGSSESFLAYLAVEAAGHIPCLLPLSLDEAGRQRWSGTSPPAICRGRWRPSSSPIAPPGASVRAP